MNSFPDSAGFANSHGVCSAVPAIEVAHHADTFRIWGPHREQIARAACYFRRMASKQSLRPRMAPSCEFCNLCAVMNGSERITVPGLKPLTSGIVPGYANRRLEHRMCARALEYERIRHLIELRAIAKLCRPGMGERNAKPSPPSVQCMCAEYQARIMQLPGVEFANVRMHFVARSPEMEISLARDIAIP